MIRRRLISLRRRGLLILRAEGCWGGSPFEPCWSGPSDAARLFLLVLSWSLRAPGRPHRLDKPLLTCISLAGNPIKSAWTLKQVLLDTTFVSLALQIGYW